MVRESILGDLHKTIADHGSKKAGTMPSLGLGVREMFKEIYIKILCRPCGRSWVKIGGYDAVLRVRV